MGKKKKVILPPELPQEVADDEVEVSDEDVNFVRENLKYAKFLTKLDTNTINRHVTRAADHKEDELEALYEKRNRKAALLKSKEEEEQCVNLVDALPIKTLDGELQYRTGVLQKKNYTQKCWKLCCEAVRSLFINEGKHGGQATLEAVRLIADHVKFHNCQLHPDSIDVFLSLTFDEDLGKSESKEEKVKPKKKKHWQNQEGSNQVQGSDRKKVRQELMVKTREEVNADFKAVSFAPDSQERRRMQSETLSAVFETYFRILKHSMDPSVSRSKTNAVASSGSHPLLASCLNGLGKFSHLIDLDFMGDLMGCLKKLAGYSDYFEGSSSESYWSVSERLQCCIVAFKVMKNNLDALNVDLQEFFVQLYNLILEYRPDRLDSNSPVLAKQ
ncbi:hypothetical protein COCNU_01G013970 [Cocos nucifera]|uniref:Uncharacterized protein n=1 Tax=Cocos nucifera TaxID=13894 RepID=A0A8K0MVC1_COCNU|nr:hypothetical protein COCNU_01G013970 [Cocos nucifera]